ncbi:hypothetical protein J4420_02290 [Candidatus Woesearchaeota archaeon]|nr:hypothetical protein [Candidatus Woesearchaeota archaeon]
MRTNPARDLEQLLAEIDRIKEDLRLFDHSEYCLSNVPSEAGSLGCDCSYEYNKKSLEGDLSSKEYEAVRAVQIVEEHKKYDPIFLNIIGTIIEEKYPDEQVPQNVQNLYREHSALFVDTQLHQVIKKLSRFNYYTMKFDESDEFKEFLSLLYETYKDPSKKTKLDRAVNIYRITLPYDKKLWSPDDPFYVLTELPEKGTKEYTSFVRGVLEKIPTELLISNEGVHFEREMDLLEVIFEREIPLIFRDILKKRDSLFEWKRWQRTQRRECISLECEVMNSWMCSFFDCDKQRLETYYTALKKVDFDNRFFQLSVPEGLNPILVYDSFATAVLASRSSLYVLGTLAQYAVTTARPSGKKPGIKERIFREFDAIAYLFKEMYQVAQSQTFKEEAPFRKAAVRSIMKVWKKKQDSFLPLEVAETLAHFNFNRFFGKDEALQCYLETAKQKQLNTDALFVNQPDILFSRILDPSYYLKMESGVKFKLGDEFINAINRLKNGLSTSWKFDELRCEFNENFSHDFFNNAAECTGNGGKYQRYGYAHRQDQNIGIIAANLYEAGKYKSTVGKAFLARCTDKNDENKKELLYVDGVVILQDIADFLEEPNQEARWLPLYTKAILQTAKQHKLNEIVFNTSHKLAQRSVWQYIRHIAGLFQLEEGRDFAYKEGRVDDGSKGNSVNIKTMSNDGFELDDTIAQQNYHYLQKVADTSYSGEHLLEGFWINHHDPAKAKNGASKIPSFVTPLNHSDIPQVNDGKGHIIGFRRSTYELIERFNQRYGKEYGIIPS